MLFKLALPNTKTQQMSFSLQLRGSGKHIKFINCHFLLLEVMSLTTSVVYVDRLNNNSKQILINNHFT